MHIDLGVGDKCLHIREKNALIRVWVGERFKTIADVLAEHIAIIFVCLFVLVCGCVLCGCVLWWFCS